MVADEPVASDLVRLGVVPRQGGLVPLRTKDEVRAALETFNAYVLEVPARHAGIVKDVVQAAIPDLKTADFQHLRRVVQFKYLPVHIQKKYRPPHPSRPRGDSGEVSSENDVAEDDDAARYFLISPSSAIAHAELVDVLKRNTPFADSSKPPVILTICVPALAPTSAEQAAKWSVEYWPISYKNTNPYGPHPSLVARNAAEIANDAGGLLGLADAVAEQTFSKGFGEKVACVVVDRTAGINEIIAVTGDCRWRCSGNDAPQRDGPGNVMAHAVQRAIAMVAKKRLRVAGHDPASKPSPHSFCDSPLTSLEEHFYSKDNIPSNGYLCVDLDIYLTHEPCVMCSMAILHSRFRRCTFGRRMPLTGGLTADNALPGKGGYISPTTGLGHGIFWRPSELNWKFLSWEWVEEDTAAMVKDSIKDTLQA
ncbi:hypothetical protein CC78DRAFT_487960 [Lojkania enalia]|uniref:CMP/dCMP-type deaminase domain-containing protein n=1 Tax=Lojkania enalia TaxID=147567 RepID=A0A9P4N9E5_9PLEO|nr:hypothetical protein CC78DRAFT_487960 [Didymosphaeria enalia]